MSRPGGYIMCNPAGSNIQHLLPYRIQDWLPEDLTEHEQNQQLTAKWQGALWGAAAHTAAHQAPAACLQIYRRSCITMVCRDTDEACIGLGIHALTLIRLTAYLPKLQNRFWCLAGADAFMA